MKTLLAIHPVDQSVESADTMIKLAQDMGAHLNMVVLGVVRTVPATVAPGVPAYYYDEGNDEIVEAAKARVAELEKRLQHADVSASVSLECQDPALVEQTLMRHALFADITVFPNKTVLERDVNTRAFNGALFKSGRPVLVLGDDKAPVSGIKKVMIAWNGETEAAKAVHHALSWLGKTKDAHVVLVDPDEYKTGPNPGDDIAAFLARRGLNVTVERLDGGSRPVADVLLEHANDIGADMIVMGAYGHSRLREWLLGGATHGVLSDAKLPILMAH